VIADEKSLRVKESDRLSTVREELTKNGRAYTEKPDVS